MDSGGGTRVSSIKALFSFLLESLWLLGELLSITSFLCLVCGCWSALGKRGGEESVMLALLVMEGCSGTRDPGIEGSVEGGCGWGSGLGVIRDGALG